MTIRVVIFVFDGLRPDMVTPMSMPNLHRFGQAGTRCAGSRVAFPTETRVNQASLVTGCWPHRHGVVGNRFMDAAAAGGTLINSGDEDELRAASEALNGNLLDMPSLGEVLGRNGMSLAVAGSGTAGGTRILHHRAEHYGHFRLSLYRPDAASCPAAVEKLKAKLGPIPAASMPAIKRTTYLVDTFLEFIVPELAPDVALLWSFEPDISYHYSGLGTDDNLAALSHVDAEFGRLLAWRDGLPAGERPTVVTLSDHGHISIEGEPLDIGAKMAEAGFSVGKSLDENVDAAFFCQRAGGIYVRDHEPSLTQQLAEWLVNEPWCELVFTERVPGTLRLSDAAIAHPRAPDIAFVTRSHDGENVAGFPGRCAHDAPGLARDGGLHGGLHARELSNWCAFQGPNIATYRVIDTPSGIVDVFPTVLHLLGLASPESVDGRVLGEILADVIPDGVVETLFDDARDMRLERSRYNGSIYLEKGGKFTQ